MRILIVDDHPALRGRIRELLSDHDHWSICAEAEDGVQGIVKAKSLRPDIILMDVSMPNMDGIQATKIVRREVPGSEVIIVSQNDPSVVKVQAKDAGAAGFVAKADLGTDLVQMIEGLERERGRFTEREERPEERSADSNDAREIH